MEPEYTEVIKVLIRHDGKNSHPVFVDEKGDEYLITTHLDGDTILPGHYQYADAEAYKIDT